MFYIIYDYLVDTYYAFHGIAIIKLNMSNFDTVFNAVPFIVLRFHYYSKVIAFAWSYAIVSCFLLIVFTYHLNISLECDSALHIYLNFINA